MKSPKAFAAKESPARAPDPEHLKAVWSQTAAQEALPVVNSLEGIADDLTAVPFTLLLNGIKFPCMGSYFISTMYLRQTLLHKRIYSSC